MKEYDENGNKLKMFGVAANRMTAIELYSVFDELKNNYFNSTFERFELPKLLKEKNSMGDIDIVVQTNPAIDTPKTIISRLGSSALKYEKNGPIVHVLFNSQSIGKSVQADFICVNEKYFDAQIMYGNFQDFSGILGVLSRRLHFKYGNEGIEKIFTDKQNQNHYIHLSDSLIDGLRMLGYEQYLHQYDKIETNQDIADFIKSSDLFDFTYFMGTGMNRSDRKRMRADRPSAQFIKEQLINSNKVRYQYDDNCYFKSLFPDLYHEYLIRIKEIDDYTPPKSKYNGDFIMEKFNLKPGKIIKDIQLHWNVIYGNTIDNVTEDEIIKTTKQFLANSNVNKPVS